MPKRLPREFYCQKTVKVARELLGKFLVHRIGKDILAGKIVETEAYVGSQDKASHASRGQTPRCKIMWAEGGHVYIYLIYGVHFMLNVVTEKAGFPAAVLIRAIECSSLISGPGKLTKALAVDKSLNGVDLVSSDEIWIEDRGMTINPSQIISAKRVGVDYAGKWKDKPWRFILRDILKKSQK